MSKSFKQKKILIAPLDWGLGHATRCIPIINVLLTLNCKITIAAAPVVKALLQTEFPNLEFLDIYSYNIKYSRKKRWMALKILLQFPKIIRAVKHEHNWLRRLLTSRHFDIIISDNRYGFYSKNVISIFITHQLQIKTSANIGQDFVRSLTYKYINHFSKCWVPDFKEKPNVAGSLSHPLTFPKIPTKYIGLLSRFEKAEHQNFTFKYLVVISGPEPQRTIFEQKIFKLMKLSDKNFLVVLGKPGNANSTYNEHNFKVHNHLTTLQLKQAFEQCEFVISRCGYTSVMEILSMQKKSILIPTTGQTEQEYLAKHLMKQNWCYTFPQDEDFNANLKMAEKFVYDFPDVRNTIYKKVIEELIYSL